MAIGLGAKLTNQAKAQFGQLMIEYDPHPPFGRLDWSTFEQKRAALAPLMSQPLTPQDPVQKRWTLNGNIVNAAGVSAGIDMALYMVSRLTNEVMARNVQWLIQYDPQPPFGGIDYQHMKLFPRLLRGIFSLMAPFYTGKARQLTRQEGKATPVHEGKERRSDLVGI
jgi:hypothetical protein